MQEGTFFGKAIACSLLHAEKDLCCIEKELVGDPLVSNNDNFNIGIYLTNNKLLRNR